MAQSDNEDFDLYADSHSPLVQELVAAREVICELRHSLYGVTEELKAKNVELKDVKNELRAKKVELKDVKQELNDALDSKEETLQNAQIQIAHYQTKYERCKSKRNALRIFGNSKLEEIEENALKMEELQCDLNKLMQKLAKMEKKYKKKKLQCKEIAKDRDQFKEDYEKRDKDFKILLNSGVKNWNERVEERRVAKATIDDLSSRLSIANGGAILPRVNVLNGALWDEYKTWMLQTRDGNIDRTQIVYPMEKIKDVLVELMERKEEGLQVDEREKIADVIKCCAGLGIIEAHEKRAFIQLNTIRNKLVHLKPCGYSAGAISRRITHCMDFLNRIEMRNE